MEKNNQLAFDIAEKEFGISPIMTGKEMASVGEPDKLSMVMYLTQFYEMFKDSLSSNGEKSWAYLLESVRHFSGQQAVFVLCIYTPKLYQGQTSGGRAEVNHLLCIQKVPGSIPWVSS